MGRSAARYSNTFPDSTPRPRPPASGISSSSASESRCSASDSRRGTYGINSTRSPRPRLSMNSRSAERKSPTNRTVTSSRPESASACRNGFGSRLPKNEPACVSRKRSVRRYSSPAKSSKSQPFAIVTTRPFGESPRASSAIASAAATSAAARGGGRRDEPRAALARLLLRADEPRLGAPVRMRADRVAQVGDPFRTGRGLNGGADQVHGVRRRRRQHHVDPLAASDAQSHRDRGQVPAHVLVGHE